MQMEALECGAAALAMVMAYHGKWVPLEQLRSDCGVSRDGSKAKNIIAAARSYGFEAQGYRMEPRDLQTVPLPCILFWNCNHFVVFCGFKKNAALINDPAWGTLIYPLDQFNAAFTGVVLTFTPTKAFYPGGKPHSIAAFAASRMKGMLGPLLFISITGLITALIGIANPVFSRIFMDSILSGAHPEWLSPLILAMGSAALIQFVVSICQSIYLLKIEGTVALTASADFLWHLLRLPLEFFSQRMTGDLLIRQRSHQDIAATLLNHIGLQVLNIAMLAFYLIVMMQYHPILTLVGIAGLLINLGLARIIAKKRAAIAHMQAIDTSKLTGVEINGITMIETIKAAGAEADYFEQWAGYQAAVNASSVRFAVTDQVWGNLPVLLQKVSEILILGLGVYFIIQGSFTMGMLLAFQSFILALMRPVTALVSAGQGIQEMQVAMERIEDVFQYPVSVPLVRAEKGQPYQKLSGTVTLKDLTFGYAKGAEPLIKGFSLDLSPGKTLALVGPSGCGKSTIAKLLAGLYTPWSGEITFDRIPQAQIPHEVLTGSLAVVDQDSTIFGDTIANNIKMWDHSIADFEMILGARDAQIHQDVMLREQGYNYHMQEGGSNFSGGQRQRFEIARMLAQDPTIIIMDEATSALDAQTEQAVVEAIKQRGITCLFIAHRLSTIRDCDEIIVMDKGLAVERGSHEQLLEAGGFYAQLVNDA
jgi:NHLM bacteriocin system ABC transporter peptidase/ATP-binding protein